MNMDKKVATRKSYGEALAQLGKENLNVVLKYNSMWATMLCTVL